MDSKDLVLTCDLCCTGLHQINYREKARVDQQGLPPLRKKTTWFSSDECQASFEQVVALLKLNEQAQQGMCNFMSEEKTEAAKKESALEFRLDRLQEGLTVLAGADVSKNRDTPRGDDRNDDKGRSCNRSNKSQNDNRT